MRPPICRRSRIRTRRTLRIPSPPANQEVDVAGQLVTMKVAADMHHVTSAALRSAFSLYRDSIDLIRPEHQPTDG